jgi:hypothetical protein
MAKRARKPVPPSNRFVVRRVAARHVGRRLWLRRLGRLRLLLTIAVAQVFRADAVGKLARAGLVEIDRLVCQIFDRSPFDTLT